MDKLRGGALSLANSPPGRSARSPTNLPTIGGGMHKALTAGMIAVLALAFTSAASAGNGAPINRGSANTLTLAVYGDAPYGAVVGDQTEIQATPAFIDSVNRDPKVDLVVHVGDIHSGSDHCSAAYDQTVA